MVETSFDVRIYSTDIYRGARTNTYKVRWKVANKLPLHQRPFKTATLAESFRSDLVSAARRGEAFRVSDGLPVSLVRRVDAQEMGWFSFACDYVDVKWKPAAATYRRGIAEAMVTITMAMLVPNRGMPNDHTIRAALFQWAFNTPRRNSGDMPRDVSETLKWVRQNTRPVSSLADGVALRRVLDSISSRLDGKLSAATVIGRKRAVLFNALDLAVERKLLDVNPLVSFKWSAPKKTSHEVDRRSVVNPVQARSLLNVVRAVPRSGRRLYACYACSYFSGLRPEEAIDIRRTDFTIPDLVWNEAEGKHTPPADDWGEFALRKAAPHAGPRWTDSGEARDERGLKHRADDEERPVPIPPELTAILRKHLAEFPPDDDGRLFYGERGGAIPVITYNRVWRKARAIAFTPEFAATPVAETPYTLRHAAVSTWLNGGVGATQVAEWAGHSVEVLLKVYAKCLHGRDGVARAAMGAAYR